MGADDGFYGEVVAADEIQDARHLVAWIHDESFARDGVANDRAIALQDAHWDGDVDQSIVGRTEGG